MPRNPPLPAQNATSDENDSSSDGDSGSDATATPTPAVVSGDDVRLLFGRKRQQHRVDVDLSVKSDDDDGSGERSDENRPSSAGMAASRADNSSPAKASHLTEAAPPTKRAGTVETIFRGLSASWDGGA
jgi:hypothetical protein